MSVRLQDNTDIIIASIKRAVKEALKEMGIVSVAEIKSNAPVDTGNLRRSYEFVCEDFSVIIGTNVDYSVYVEFKASNQGGRPHFRNSLGSLKSQFESILQNKLGGI